MNTIAFSEKKLLQKTTLPCVPTNEERKWYFLDLKGKVVGNWAPLIIERLRGKDRLDFFPGLDLGGVVVIINAKEAFFTEKELNQVKHHHSGYPGGLKTETIRLMLEKSPRNLTFRIIKGMMPLGKLGKKQLGRLFIYPDGSHLHKAQERGFIPLTSKKI